MSRKIYFCGSIRGGCQDRELYLQIIEQLRNYGEVLTEHAFFVVKSPEQDGKSGTQDKDVYLRIIKQLMGFGEVLTEHVFNNVTTPENDGIIKTDKEIHDGDVKWLEECNAVVAEVTQPSLGVGYEIGRAVALNKKILCLFRTDSDKHLSAMISGAHNDSTFIVKNYKEEDVPGILKDFFDNCNPL